MKTGRWGGNGVWLLLGISLLVAACGDDRSVGAVAREKGLLFAPDSGIAANVPESAVLAAGWSLCYQDTYATSGIPLSTILSLCDAPYLMLACLPGGTATLVVAAAGARADVTFDTGAGNATSAHTANGVSWYYNDNWSWGFFVPGDGVNKSSCDVELGAFDAYRLCWHAGTGAGAPSATLAYGYRCGSNQSLNSDPTWLRRIYHHL